MANGTRTGMWLIVAAWWLYFVTAVVLYGRGLTWANTLDNLLAVAVLLVVSIGYTVDRFRFRGQPRPPRRWGLGLWGIYRRADATECDPRH